MATHRMTNSATYKSWLKMKERCTNPKAAQWKWYGGRGISVCERWLNSFVEFLADMGVRPSGTTIDRRDPDGDYEASNCRWADHRTQIHAQRKTIRVIVGGASLPLTVACDGLGLSFSKIYQRMKKGGMTFDEARTTIGRKKKSEEALREYVELRRSGQQLSTLAARFQMSVSGMEKWSTDARRRGWL